MPSVRNITVFVSMVFTGGPHFFESFFILLSTDCIVVIVI